ncbi:MAG: DegT/DnrJ/EryC1/StrS family aminotransferase [Betaproteobacteria bacterium]|nr:DegT/DnrJ/EryC1/StrS family aminotransferase [Betaproteobacteria bacterium]MDH3435826.1 DegT/DnrJ/EryC1/StrS family aminotransferase [Betaproteobacteria bacterium]
MTLPLQNNRGQETPALAIFGGVPAFVEQLHVGRPNIGNRERFLARLNDILDRRWLSNRGEYVIELERRICDFIGVRNCVLVCNGTIGLELLIRALGLRGEVIVPSFTFVATAHALQWQEITPVFADIDPHTHCLDPRSVESAITPRTTGIIGVHVWGRPCAIDELTAIAGRRNLKLMFDAAHAFACSSGERMIGSFGEAEVLSFHATKLMNTFEGGAIVTDDDDLAEKLRLMQNFGFKGYDRVVYLGINGKMSEVAAAMGLTNLENLHEMIACNRANYRAYEEHLARIPGVRLLAYDEQHRSTYQYVVTTVGDDSALTRDELVDVLHAENVMARRYFHPGVHRMEPYRSCFPDAHLLLPATERVCRQVLVLPTGTAVSAQDIARLCELIKTALANAPAVRKRLVEAKALTS